MSEMPEMPFTCPLCVTWSCDLCGYRIYYQNPNYRGTRRCKSCGSSVGTMHNVTHTSISFAEDHWEQYQLEQVAVKNDRPYTRSFDQGATTIARLEREEKTMPTAPEPKRWTAEDFANAEWCIHPHGGFGHRFGHDLDFPWAVAEDSKKIAWYSDEGLAERLDFEPVTIPLTIDRKTLTRIVDKKKYRDSHECYFDVVKELGFEITETFIDVPTEPGIRFKAKAGINEPEWLFVTFQSRTDFAPGIICVTEPNNGIKWDYEEFQELFTVTGLL